MQENVTAYQASISFQKPDKTRIVLLFFNFTLHLIAFFLFFGTRFSVDSYGAYMKGGYLFDSMVSNYRFTGAVIIKLLEQIGRNPVANDTLEILLYCVITSFVTATLSWMLIKKIQRIGLWEKACIGLGVLMTVLHVIMGSQVSFPECVLINTAGMLFCFLSICFLEKKRTVLHAVISGILLVIAIGTFQFYLELFLLYSGLFAMIQILQNRKEQNKRDVIRYTVRELLYPLCVFLISLCIYYLIARLTLRITGIQGTDRTGLSLHTIISNIRFYLINQHKYLSWTKYFSGEYMTICAALLCGLWCLSLWRAKRRGVSNRQLVLCAVWSGLIYVSMYFLPVISSVHSYRAMGGVMGIYLIATTGILLFNRDSQYASKFLSVILTCALVLNITGIIRHESNLIRTNEIDEAWANDILQFVYQYEEDQDTVVSKIAFCEDEHPTTSYLSYSYTGPAMAASWARKEILNVFKNPDHELFTQTEMNQEIYRAHFAGKDWDKKLINEQVVIQGDTVFICCY